MVKRILKDEVKENNFFTDKPKAIVNFINKSKDEGKRAADILVKHDTRFQQLIYSKYEQILRAENKIDFGELILLTKGSSLKFFIRSFSFRFAELLDKEIDLRRHYAKKFRFVLIDEFQDTSTLQMDWLKLMIDQNEQTKAIENCFMAVVSWSRDRKDRRGFVSGRRRSEHLRLSRGSVREQY